MISDNLKQKLLEALKDDRITLTMLENNISRLNEYIDLLSDNTNETKLCKLYTMSRQLIYLITTFGDKNDSIEQIKNRIAISNYLALSDANKVEQGAQLAYENDFIKDFLKCSNTILNIADKAYNLGKPISDKYSQYRTEMIKLMSEVYAEIFNDLSSLLDRKFWIETLEWIKEQLNKEIDYLDKKSNIPSERTIANVGISEDKYFGIQALLDYNKSYEV